jgi:hypothetical protein
MGSPRLRTQDPFRTFKSRTRYLRQLLRDRRILDLSIVHQQKRLTENYAQDAIALKRQGKIRSRIPGTQHDTQVATARLHQNVAASDVDVVLMQLPANQEKTTIYPARCCQLAAPGALPAPDRREAEVVGLGGRHSDPTGARSKSS